MRWTLILLPLGFLCAGFLAGCDSGFGEKREQPSPSSSSADLKPPLISEQFTLLPCPPKPKSTLDFEGCAEHEIIRSDEAINELVEVIFSERLKSATARRRFVRGERVWLTYRRSACASRADVYEGGSAAGIVFAECVVAKNSAHLKDLRAFERNLRPK